MERRIRKRRSAAGFTLLEVMLVLAILVVLGSMAAVAVSGRQDKAERAAARAQVLLLSNEVKSYEFDVRRYPESLEELIKKPTDDKLAERWGGPYLNKKSIPLDPWQNEYRYEVNGNSYRVWSTGPDGSDGGDDDISSDDE